MTTYKMLDVVGTSATSVSDAIRTAVERASQTIDDLSWFEVKEIRGRLQDGEIAEYQVRVEMGFLLHASGKARDEGAAGKERGTKQSRSQAAQVAAKRGERRRTDLARGFEKQPGGKAAKGRGR